MYSSWLLLPITFCLTFSFENSGFCIPNKIMDLSLRTLLLDQTEQLRAIYPIEEAREMVYQLAEHFLTCSRHGLLMALDEPYLPDFEREMHLAMGRLLKNEPLQYIVGSVEFYGVELNVAPGVLIPRPETEELVDMIVKEWRGKSPSIVDFGTGSGCIPIALKKALPLSTVSAVDISADALAIASSNAQRNGVHVDFIQADMRQFTSEAKLDVIVSNPPYVMQSEQALMRSNVVDYEPHLALFVSDSDPLEFYKSLAELAKRLLNGSGCVYLEINQQLGELTASLFRDIGMDTSIHKDFFGVDRFVVARWKTKK